MEKVLPEIIDDTRKGIVADMHTHSEHSHDSICPIADMADTQRNNGTSIFAVTDHCDVEYFETQDLEQIISGSVSDTEKQNIKDTLILRGVEIGEGFWNKAEAQKIISANDYDVIIGSVHAVRYEEYTKPYSGIDFGKLGKEKSAEYFNKYFDDMLYMIENTEFDILAHLTCPLRYINGKYGLNIDCMQYKEKIKKILHLIINNNIALEVNTSCLGSAYNEFMPEEWIISLYKEMGGFLVTLGSDAHIKENASHCFDEAIKMLKRNDFDSIFYFENRHIYRISI